MTRKSFWMIIGSITLLNFIAVNLGVYLSAFSGNMDLFFEERQTITFLSSLELAVICLVAVFIYVLKRFQHFGDITEMKRIRFWLVCAAIFALASADEYFMIHEGIDRDIALLFGSHIDPDLDGVTLSLYAIAGGAMFYWFKEQLLRHKKAVAVFLAGGLLFFGSLCVDFKTQDQLRVIIEESMELMAVGTILAGFLVVLVESIKELEKNVFTREGA